MGDGIREQPMDIPVPNTIRATCLVHGAATFAYLPRTNVYVCMGWRRGYLPGATEVCPCLMDVDSLDIDGGSVIYFSVFLRDRGMGVAADWSRVETAINDEFDVFVGRQVEKEIEPKTVNFLDTDVFDNGFRIGTDVHLQDGSKDGAKDGENGPTSL